MKDRKLAKQNMDAISDIPVLDVKGLTEKEEDLQDLVCQIHHAFTNIGFVAIVNHNIAENDVEKAWSNVKKFHQLPVATKEKYREKTKDKQYGWSPLGAQKLYNPGSDVPSAADYREGFSLLPSNFNWPQEVPNIKETTLNVAEQMYSLGKYVLRLMAMALNLEDSEYFVNHHHSLCSDRNPSSLSFATYPPIPEGPFDTPGGLFQGQMRCGEHTDWGSIALLIQDEHGGLEVQRKDGTWIETRPPPNTVMVNVGDMMQRWTADKFISTNHRVREPQDKKLKRRTRRSLVFFLDPDDDTLVSCLDGSNKYPPVNASEYLWQRASQHLE